MNMTPLQFNLNLDDLKDSVMDSSLDHVVKSAIVLILNEYMEKERDEYLQADPYERSDQRRDYRNGYYEREYTISLGKIKLKVPRTRNGEFTTDVFERYARYDQVLILSMLEMVINGVSTRKVTHIIEQLCGESVSKSLVSSLTQKLDPIVNEWSKRPLNTQYYPYLFVDAMYIKVREHHRIVSKAVYIATAISDQNKREILGLMVDHVESFDSWSRFLQQLKERGLQSPKLITSDAHAGLQKAIQREFIGTTWQRCYAHFKRNIMDKLPKKGNDEFKSMANRIFNAVKVEDMRSFKEELLQQFEEEPKYKAALAVLEDGFEDTMQYMNEPVSMRRYVRSTNYLERLNQEVRRRERVIRIFPNTQSAFRLIGGILMHFQDKVLAHKESLIK
jgi:putative transposase